MVLMMENASKSTESAFFNRESQISQRHNMQCGIAHGSFFRMATAFADPFAVIPLFFAGFTDSRVLIGLVVSLMEAMSIAPQLPISRILRRKSNSAKPIMLTGIWTRCGVWGVIAVIALTMDAHSIWIPVLFAFLVSVYSFGAGFAVLPFRFVIAETISENRRSSFFGWRQLIGGVLAVIAGIFVKVILGMDSLAWPRNYGMLFLLSFISLIVAYTAMSQFRFPLSSVDSAHPRIPNLRNEIREALRQYPVLKRLIVVRLLAGGLPLALPFFTLYATQEAGAAIAWVGVLVAAQQSGVILSNFIWIPLGNRSGTRSVILSGIILATIAIGIILIIPGKSAFFLAFAFSGSAMSAMIVGFGGYILEIGHSEIRPFLFALEGVLLFPLYFAPLLGGLIADKGGYQAVMGFGAGLTILALLVAVTLCEPRRNDARCGPRDGDRRDERCPIESGSKYQESVQ